MVSPKTEDYLEAIYLLVQRKGYARVKDLAEELGVKPPTVTGMLSRLKEKRYINYEKRGGIAFTPKGRKTALEVAARREVFLKLLRMIYVPGETAEKDACVLEHSLHPETVRQFSLLVEFMEKEKGFMEMFGKYSKKKK